MHLTYSLRLLVFSVIAAVCSSGLRADADEQLDGMWVIKSATESGEATKRPVGDSLTFAGNKLTIEIRSGGTNPPPLAITVDPSKSPKQLDLTMTADGATRVVKGVYEVQDGVLKTSWARPGEPRPATVDSKEKNHYSFVCQRQVEEADE